MKKLDFGLDTSLLSISEKLDISCTNASAKNHRHLFILVYSCLYIYLTLFMPIYLSLFHVDLFYNIMVKWVWSYGDTHCLILCWQVEIKHELEILIGFNSY